MDAEGTSMPLPATTDSPSGGKSGGIKGFFSKFSAVRKSGSKADAPVATGAAAPTGTGVYDEVASVPPAGTLSSP